MSLKTLELDMIVIGKIIRNNIIKLVIKVTVNLMSFSSENDD